MAEIGGPWPLLNLRVPIRIYFCNRKSPYKIIFHIIIDIRFNGTDTEGYLEVNGYAGWGAVCSNMFGIEEAMVACRQLHLGQPLMYRRNSELSSSPYYFSRLYCYGTEQRLSECYGYNDGNACYNTYLQCSGTFLEFFV